MQIAARGRLVGAVFASDFDAGPLTPQVHAGSGLDNIDDESAADARRSLEKVPRAVAGTDELGVRHAANEAERLQ